MVALVLITAASAGVRYTRFVGRKPTHEGVSPEPLSADEVEAFRASASAEGAE